jgi:hypothetical protein
MASDTNIFYPSKGYCLSAGTYKFTINDKFKDGMNAGDGGSYAGYVAGTKRFGSPSGESDWGQRVHEFSVGTSTDTINSAEQFTAKIDTTDTDELWLVAHNSRRKEWHTRYGKSYVPLNWSNALKAQAKAYAKELLSTCGGELVHGEISHTMPYAHPPASFYSDHTKFDYVATNPLRSWLRQHCLRRKSGFQFRKWELGGIERAGRHSRPLG